MQFQIHLQPKIAMVFVKSALKGDLTTTSQHLKINPAEKYRAFHLYLGIERELYEWIERDIHTFVDQENVICVVWKLTHC